jgi:DNA-directed RNA polymerase specialized sigma24 family protein
MLLDLAARNADLPPRHFLGSVWLAASTPLTGRTRSGKPLSPRNELERRIRNELKDLRRKDRALAGVREAIAELPPPAARPGREADIDARRALSRRSDAERLLLLGAGWMGVPLSELAPALGVSENTLSKRRQRAVEALKEELEE